uniref:Uncharacterized protein n=1 Tax=Trichobilharzia regenti TaxID=157069 RepID=A0AA85IPI1_TRIRE|nr:unnamed protein product [Trichobilharzia regenti]
MNYFFGFETFHYQCFIWFSAVNELAMCGSLGNHALFPCIRTVCGKKVTELTCTAQHMLFISVILSISACSAKYICIVNELSAR